MYSEIEKNKLKTLFILVGFFVLVAGLAGLATLYFGNRSVFVYTMIGSAVYALISYFASARMALALNGAKEISKQDSPELWRTIENLTIANGMPMPKVYIMEEKGLNAFATGRNPDNSSVAITTGLLEVLDKKELEGVMAHELGHIKNYDIRVSLMAFAAVGVISLLCDFFLRVSWYSGGLTDDDDSAKTFAIFGIVAAIIAPIVATMLQLALSRRREYLADASGALTTRYPEGLANALRKIQAYGSTVKRQNSSTAHLFIANPLKGGFFSSLFSTHPPIDERIARLEKMGSQL
ncbi:MAG: M48 family metalloprotease [bacterium]|nr:M48 family metalloprotease [bacterium]